MNNTLGYEPWNRSLILLGGTKFCIKDQKEKLDYVSQKIDLIYGEVKFLKETILSKM